MTASWIWDVLKRLDAAVIVREARDWLSDCVWRDLDVDAAEDAVADLTDTGVLGMVDAHYGGGLDAFLRACSL